MIVLRGRIQVEHVLPSSLRIFQVDHGSDLGEADLLVESLFRCTLVDGEEVWSQDKIDLFPLLS